MIIQHNQVGFIPGKNAKMVQYMKVSVIYHINRMNKEKHKITSNDIEKTFDKIQHYSIIKTLNKLGIEGNYHNTKQSIYEKPTANIIINSESFSPKITKTRLSAFATSIQHNIGTYSQSN